MFLFYRISFTNGVEVKDRREGVYAFKFYVVATAGGFRPSFLIN